MSAVSVLTRGIPNLDARALGLFRILFGAAFLVLLWRMRPGGDLLQAVHILGLVAAAAFVAGVWTRPALIVTTLAFCAIAVQTNRASHPFAVLVLGMFALWPCRWGDARSINVGRVLRLDPPDRVPDVGLPPTAYRPLPTAHLSDPSSQSYGYGIWVPTFIVGVACFAAAIAKLREGLAWILNGTVKYAFVADYDRARVDWGLWIASQPELSVALSAAAVLVEAGLITVAFSKSRWYRLAGGLAACGLFGGFYLLQGELWPAWWILFLGYLPWDVLSRWLDALVGHAKSTVAGPGVAVAGARGVTVPQLLVILLLIGQQVAASAAHLELRPVLSQYDMYANTFESTTEFEEENPEVRHRFVVTTRRGEQVDRTECVERSGAGEDIAAGEVDRSRLDDIVRPCIESVVSDAERFVVLEDHRAFDWQGGRFYWKYRARPVREFPMSGE